MLENRNHILVFPADNTGCGRYRMIWPGQAAYNAGKPVNVMTRPPKIEVDSRGVVHGITVGTATAVVFQRPASYQMAQAIPILQEQGIKVIIDLDDSLSTIHPRNSAFRTYDPRVSPNKNWMHAARACELADLVTVTTEALAEEYGGHGRVSIIPNHIPESYLQIERPNNDVPVVGWMGSTRTHVDDLPVTNGMINKVLTETNSKFIAFGDIQIFVDLTIRAQHPHELWGFTSIEEYPKNVINFDIGLVPLQKSKFNDCKCLDAETKVSTRRGIVPMGSLSTQDDVWHNSKWVEVLGVNQELPRPGLLLTTYDGYQLKLTPEHRLMVNGKWTTADQIAVGDTVDMEPDSTGVVDYVRVPWPADSRMTRGAKAIRETQHLADFTQATDGPTILITPRWGRILGAFAGDGGLTGKTALTISCDGIDQDWIDMLTDDFKACGLAVGTEQKKMYNGTLLRRRSIRVSSAHLLRVFDSLGVVRHREGKNPIRRVCVPQAIWESPLDVIAAFLAGYFEADGSCSGSSVSAVSKSEQLIRDIQRLLLLFGIESRIKPRRNKDQNGTEGEYWMINLRRASVDIFQKEIGFYSNRKQERLSLITSKPHSNAYQPLVWQQEIVSISDCFVTPIDIQVEGEVFAAAGFVSHNSWLKCVEYASLGVVPVASPTPDNLKFAELGGCIIAHTPADWEREVKELILDKDKLAEMSKQVREVASEWTIEGNWNKWYDAWSSESALVV